MRFDGERWVSADGRWIWDGDVWRPRPAERRLLAETLSVGYWVARTAIGIQSASTGCLGSMTLLVGLLTIVAGGLRWLGLAGIFLAVGVLIVGLGSLIGWILTRVGPDHPRWTFAAFLVQWPLIVAGVAMVALEAAYQPGTPDNPGTDGPFADGGNGVIALAGMTYVGGGAIAIGSLLQEQALIAARTLKRRATD